MSSSQQFITNEKVFIYSYLNAKKTVLKRLGNFLKFTELENFPTGI